VAEIIKKSLPSLFLQQTRFAQYNNNNNNNNKTLIIISKLVAVTQAERCAFSELFRVPVTLT